jgi:hypothetical protein
VKKTLVVNIQVTKVAKEAQELSSNLYQLSPTPVSVAADQENQIVQVLNEAPFEGRDKVGTLGAVAS